jgi:hypothetical protein
VSKTKKIQLEIYEDKITNFYLALLNWKTTDNADIKVLKTIANAIHFDQESLANGIEITPAQKERIRERMASIHDSLLKSKKDSEDYYTVSKESLENFNGSSFGKELNGLLYAMEVKRMLTGREESIEAKVSIAAFTKFITSLMNAFVASIKLPLFESKKGVYRVKADKNSYLLYEFGEGEYTIEAGLFVETSKGIKHIHPTNDLLMLNDEDIHTIFLTVNDDAIRLNEKEDEITVAIYDNVKTEKGFLYISNASIGQTFSIPKELFKNGEISETDIFKSIEKEFNRVFKLPMNTPERIEDRDRDIMSIHTLLVKHYSSITQHVAYTITGYIASSTGLLYSEGLYIISDSKQPYRKYLRDTIYNIIQKHQR